MRYSYTFQVYRFEKHHKGYLNLSQGTQLEKYQENWILYRTSSELLKKEEYFYEYSNLDNIQEKQIIG